MLSENLLKLELHINSVLAESVYLTAGEFKCIIDISLMTVIETLNGDDGLGASATLTLIALPPEGRGWRRWREGGIPAEM